MYNSAMSSKMTFLARSIRKADMRFVLGIEKMTNGHPWVEADFMTVAMSTTDFCIVAALPGSKSEEEVIGHVVARCENEILGYLRIGVNPDWQRCGVGQALVKMVQKNAGYFKSERAFAEYESKPHHSFWTKLGFAEDRHIEGQGVVYARRR